MIVTLSPAVHRPLRDAFHPHHRDAFRPPYRDATTRATVTLHPHRHDSNRHDLCRNARALLVTPSPFTEGWGGCERHGGVGGRRHGGVGGRRHGGGWKASRWRGGRRHGGGG